MVFVEFAFFDGVDKDFFCRGYNGICGSHFGQVCGGCRFLVRDDDFVSRLLSGGDIFNAKQVDAVGQCGEVDGGAEGQMHSSPALHVENCYGQLVGGAIVPTDV